jgi:hypothetical protein
MARNPAGHRAAKTLNLIQEVLGMRGRRIPTIAIITGLLTIVVGAQDKYTLKVPNGLSFSEFRGYEA